MVKWSAFTCPEFSWIRRFEQVFRDNKTLRVIAAVCYLVIQQFRREPKGTSINGFFTESPLPGPSGCIPIPAPKTTRTLSSRYPTLGFAPDIEDAEPSCIITGIFR